MKLLTTLDLNKNELLNAKIQNLATDPENNPVAGQMYYNSTDKKVRVYNGNTWENIGSVVTDPVSGDGKITIDGVVYSVYDLPTASASILGGVKVGTGLSIDANGVLTVSEADAVEWSNVLNKPTDLVEDASYVHTDNNYTTTEKNKLAGIASGAEVNVNADWSAISGDAQILNKPVALSAFTNDSGFITSSVTNLTNYYLKTEVYTQSQVNDLIGQIATIQIEVVGSLPSTGQSNIIYLVPKNPGQTNNIYDEYIWTSTAFEKVGDTTIDLSGYLEKTGDSSNTTVSFVESNNRNLPVTGDSVSTIIGKIIKYLKDLKTSAFTGDYDDLVNKPSTIKKASFDISTAQTTNSLTINGGTTIVGVMVIDDTTKEIVMCDITVEGMKITATTISNPEHLLKVIITYY